MKNYCVVRHTNSPSGEFNREIVAVCNELKQPVCSKHAYYCNDDEHGTSELPSGLLAEMKRAEMKGAERS